jgi:membrane-bound lytic murein transglycosylase MltF
MASVSNKNKQTLPKHIMKPGQVSINTLVIRLELAVLGFVLIVLLLSALDRANQGSQETAEQNNQEPANAAMRTTLFTDVHVPARQREVWFGDLDGILKRGQLRVLIPFSQTFFFQKNGQNLGLSTEIFKLYERFLNDQVMLDDKKMEIVFLPTPHERLLEELLEGKGDVIAADIPLHLVQEQQVKLISPATLEIQEILVTGPNAPHFKSIFNLSGQTITVREHSPYAASLQKLNNTLTSIGKKPVTIQFSAPFLRDEDLLEMTGLGLLPMTVIDNNIGEFWTNILYGVTLHQKIALRTAKELTWLIRKDNLLLEESIRSFKENNYLPQDGHQSLTEYYRQQGGEITNNLKPAVLVRYKSLLPLFEKYGKKYHFPPQLLAAIAYQRSELDPAFGKNGAVGVMGLDPSATLQEGLATELKKIRDTEYNIQTGARYLRFLADHYFSSSKFEELDQNLMAVAAYQASPEQVIAARKKAALAGFDPDLWFNHTEAFLSSREPEEDPYLVRSIRNIYKYFTIYEQFSSQSRVQNQ